MTIRQEDKHCAGHYGLGVGSKRVYAKPRVPTTKRGVLLEQDTARSNESSVEFSEGMQNQVREIF